MKTAPIPWLPVRRGARFRFVCVVACWWAAMISGRAENADGGSLLLVGYVGHSDDSWQHFHLVRKSAAGDTGTVSGDWYRLGDTISEGKLVAYDRESRQLTLRDAEGAERVLRLDKAGLAPTEPPGMAPTKARAYLMSLLDRFEVDEGDAAMVDEITLLSFNELSPAEQKKFERIHERVAQSDRLMFFAAYQGGIYPSIIPAVSRRDRVPPEVDAALTEADWTAYDVARTEMMAKRGAVRLIKRQGQRSPRPTPKKERP